MKFRTEIEIEPYPIKIEHNETIFTIGSCFAENVGNYFLKYKFNSLINPFGVLYNTASIKNSFELITLKKVFTKDDLIFDQDEWHSFFHHSDFSSHKFEDVLEKINSNTKNVAQFIKNVDWVIISLGTSFVYRHIEKNIIVSNCHKIPSKKFNKEFLDVEENSINISELINLIRNESPKAKIILTVSPIRHWKDGARQNQLSKSSLHLAVNNIINSFENVFYFPSYEILIDELRDYRFYNIDMLHPNDQAVEYIWEKFSQTVLSDKCQLLITEIKRIIDASEHKIRNLHSVKTKEFSSSQINKIRSLVKIHPHLNFDDELKKFFLYLNENNLRETK